MKMKTKIKTLFDVQKEVSATAVKHGFHDNDKRIKDVPGGLTYLYLARLMLIVTEAAEAAECLRDGNYEKLGYELADIIIRTVDTAEDCGINLEHYVLKKMEINKNRPFRHGGKLA